MQASTINAAARVLTLEAELAVARAAQQAAVAAQQAAVASQWAANTAQQRLADEYMLLKQAYEAVRTELALLKHRLFVAKAERVDLTQLQLEFTTILARAQAIAAQLDGHVAPVITAGDSAGGDDDGPRGRTRKPRSTPPPGRRDLRTLALPEQRVELVDETLEGVFPRCGFEESSQLMWKRASWTVVVLARVKYQTPADGTTAIVTTPLPLSLLPRSIAGPTVWAALIVQKLLEGMPYHRQQDKLTRAGVALDRGTMSRWQEELGATVGATVVEAARAHVLRTAFAIATDATGVMVQPVPRNDQTRQPCRRGHYFVQIADAEHVFFEYTPTETSAAVGTMFAGFAGHVVADAKSVYDVLFRPPAEQLGLDVRNADDAPAVGGCTEVACWSHARRGMWEAAIITKDPLAREGLARIMSLFVLEQAWKKLPPAERGALRAVHAAPIVDDLLQWVTAQWPALALQRGLIRSAFGYLRNQAVALRQYLTDGRLPMTNNESERELRRIAMGRKAWLFVGSDDHAQAAGNLLSLIATARRHQLDPELYLAELFRVLPAWPRDRYLELWPAYWARTRARLNPDELAIPVGNITVPPTPLES